MDHDSQRLCYKHQMIPLAQKQNIQTKVSTKSRVWVVAWETYCGDARLSNCNREFPRRSMHAAVSYRLCSMSSAAWHYGLGQLVLGRIASSGVMIREGRAASTDALWVRSTEDASEVSSQCRSVSWRRESEAATKRASASSKEATSIWMLSRLQTLAVNDSRTKVNQQSKAPSLCHLRSSLLNKSLSDRVRNDHTEAE